MSTSCCIKTIKVQLRQVVRGVILGKVQNHCIVAACAITAESRTKFTLLQKLKPILLTFHNDFSKKKRLEMSVAGYILHSKTIALKGGEFFMQ